MNLLPRHNGVEHDHNAPIHLSISLTFMLFVHLMCYFVSFGLIYPYSFACKRAGLSQRHLIFQIVGAALGLVGFFAGHLSGIEWYNSWLADIGCMLAWGITAGSFLLLIYVPKGVLSHMKNAINYAHNIASTLQPLVCWVTMGMSITTLLQYCGNEGSHLGQCLAHGIMGTAFITYGIILLTMMYVGQGFLRRINRSQESLDSWVIMIWGIINTFTEHRWGQDWSHGDLQHTSMGIVWWAMGALGIYMSWDHLNDKPKRTHLPALIILATGYAMMTHTQNTYVSTNIHFMFGVMLVLAAVARIIEISFVLKDAHPVGNEPSSWQYLTPIFLVESGMMFMSATEEAMDVLHRESIMAAPYVLLVSSVAAIIFLVSLFIVQSYVKMRQMSKNEDGRGKKERGNDEDIEMPFLGRADLNNQGVEADDFELSE